MRVPGSASDPTRLGRMSGVFHPPPRICRQTAHRRRPSAGGHPPQRVRESAATPPDPVRPAEHRRPQGEERSGRDHGRGSRTRFCPLGQNFAEGPQLRLALALLDAQGVSSAGGVGARGRAARPTNAGGYCEHLQGIAGAE
jgi:hypothetical protein